MLAGAGGSDMARLSVLNARTCVPSPSCEARQENEHLFARHPHTRAFRVRVLGLNCDRDATPDPTHLMHFWLWLSVRTKRSGA